MAAAKGDAGREGDGIPYTGAAERFMRIAETASEGAFELSHCECLTMLPATGETFAFLRKVPTSKNPVAGRAVILLANEMGTQAQAVAPARKNGPFAATAGGVRRWLHGPAPRTHTAAVEVAKEQ